MYDLCLICGKVWYGVENTTPASCTGMVVLRHSRYYRVTLVFVFLHHRVMALPVALAVFAAICKILGWWEVGEGGGGRRGFPNRVFNSPAISS